MTKAHKGQNLIDDLLDGTLAFVSIGYLILAPKLGIHLDDQTILAIATAGATVRLTLRKLLIHFWGEKLGIEQPAVDAPVATEGAEGDH